ncbi:MAG: hypothetical protein ACOZFS_02785 [Thermodesulfobacteriota bacterium]
MRAESLINEIAPILDHLQALRFRVSPVTRTAVLAGRGKLKVSFSALRQ